MPGADLLELSDIFEGPVAEAAPGRRVAIKDCMDVRGLPTGCGSRAFEGAQPAKDDAEVVARLRRAGYVILGKTTMHELAFGVTGINDWAGTPPNALDPQRILGGSSSGSAAAVAHGLADIAIGTDTGGSIRVPAACCGIAGLKPSFGRISRVGVLPAVTTLDCVGPLAGNPCGLMEAMAVLADDFLPEPVEDIVVGRIAVNAEPGINEAVDVALEAAGVPVVPLALPNLGRAFEAGLSIINRESLAAWGHLIDTGLLGQDVQKRLERAGAVTRCEIEAAEAMREVFREEVNRLLDQVTLLALPTMPCFPPTIEEARRDLSAVALTAFVRPFNLSGHPALSMPIWRSLGFPASLQLVGRHGADALLCQIAIALSSKVKVLARYQ
jgi:amidase